MLLSLAPLNPRIAKIVLQHLADPVASLVIEIQCYCMFRYVLEQLKDVFTLHQLKSLFFTSHVDSNHSGIFFLGFFSQRGNIEYDKLCVQYTQIHADSQPFIP